MSPQSRAVRRTGKAIGVQAINLCIILGMLILAVFVSAEPKYPDAWKGCLIVTVLPLLWTIGCEMSIRKQLTLMRFGEVGMATITGGFTIPLRYSIHVRFYEFSTPDGRPVSTWTTVDSLDAITMVKPFQVEIVYDPRRPRRAMFSHQIWAAALIEADSVGN